MKRAFPDKKLDKSSLRERALRGEPAAGGFFFKIDFLRYRISFTNICILTPQILKKPSAAGHFHSPPAIVFVTISSEIRETLY